MTTASHARRCLYIISTYRNVRGPTLNAERINQLLKSQPVAKADTASFTLLVLPLFASTLLQFSLHLLLYFTLRFASQEAEREEEESTTDEESTDGSEAGGNTGACAKRKRECDGNDEGELSRPSKRTLPPSPSVSSDVVVEHVPDSGTRRMRVDLPRPAASAPAIAAASGPGVGSVTRVPDFGTRRMTMVLPRPAASAPAIAAASGPGVGSVTRVLDSGTRIMRVVLPRPAASAPAIAAAPPPPPPTLAIAAAPPPLARENPRLVRGRVATACVAAATFVVTAILFVRE